jgi:hypothetical protein
MALYHLAHYTARSEQCSINEYIMATEQARAGVSDIPQVRSAKRQPDPGLHGPAAFWWYDCCAFPAELYSITGESYVYWPSLAQRAALFILRFQGVLGPFEIASGVGVLDPSDDLSLGEGIGHIRVGCVQQRRHRMTAQGLLSSAALRQSAKDSLVEGCVNPKDGLISIVRVVARPGVKVVTLLPVPGGATFTASGWRLFDYDCGLVRITHLFRPLIAG